MKGWLHRILDLPADAQAKALRAGFATQLKAFHPDRCPDNPDNRQRLLLIRVAHEVLRNPGYRAEHEKTGRIPDGVELGETLREHLKDPGALSLARGFLHAFQREKPVDGKAKVIRINLSAEELIRGTSRLVDIKRSIACTQCGGSGSEKTPPPRRCHVCDATGTITWPRRLVRGMPCAFCKGKGIIVVAPCIRCMGKSYAVEEQPFRVRVPPGVPEGHRVVLRGEGERGSRGGRHGDLVILLFLDKRSPFRRDGIHLFIEVPLEPGASSVQIVHPDGKLSLPIPDGFAFGTLIAAGHGLPTLADPSQRGDLRVKITDACPVDPRKEIG